MTGVTGAPRFPLSLTSDSKVIIGFEFNDLSLDEQEVVQLLNNFELMSSRLLITLDHGDGSGIHEYLGMFVVDKNLCFEVVYSLHCLIFLMCLSWRENSSS